MINEAVPWGHEREKYMQNILEKEVRVDRILIVTVYAGKACSYLIGLNRSPLATGYQQIKSATDLFIRSSFVLHLLSTKFLFVCNFMC